MDDGISKVPSALEVILRDSERIGFTLASEPKTGSLLRTLAASKPGGRFLELGTGTGVGTAWLLSGMDAGSRLISVDRDDSVQEIAKRHLGHDQRVTFHLGDGERFLEQKFRVSSISFMRMPGRVNSRTWTWRSHCSKSVGSISSTTFCRSPVGLKGTRRRFPRSSRTWKAGAVMWRRSSPGPQGS